MARHWRSHGCHDALMDTSSTTLPPVMTLLSSDMLYETYHTRIKYKLCRSCFLKMVHYDLAENDGFGGHGRRARSVISLSTPLLRHPGSTDKAVTRLLPPDRSYSTGHRPPIKHSVWRCSHGPECSPPARARLGWRDIDAPMALSSHDWTMDSPSATLRASRNDIAQQ